MSTGHSQAPLGREVTLILLGWELVVLPGPSRLEAPWGLLLDDMVLVDFHPSPPAQDRVSLPILELSL